MQILLATNNQGKVIELENLLTGLDIQVLSLRDFPEIPEIEENGQTFAENAKIKAEKAAILSNLVTLADDSGLEVDALNGEPGIFSARYAGEPKDDLRNTQKLLKNLLGVPLEKRTARFRCSLAIVCPDGQEYLTEGTVEGIILHEEKGQGGFGYDPVFYLPEKMMTMAELTLEEKNTWSHRAQAFYNAIPILKEIEKIF